MPAVRTRLDLLDVYLTTWMARYSIPLLRIGLGTVFLWFGALKFFPGLSPAQDLATQTISALTLGIVQPAMSLPLLAFWECLIGLGLITGRWTRATLLLLWFGALKFFPGLSPAQDLATQTISALTLGIVQPAVSLPLLAFWECLIGLGLITGRWTRVTLLLLWAQMLGTITPLLLFPSEAFTWFPFVPTLEGQYIIKNIVLVCAGLVIGATARGGYLVAEPAKLPRSGI